MNKESSLSAVSRSMRLNILRLANQAGRKGAHIAPSLSMVEIMAVLFSAVMKPEDSFVLSKGHGGLCYYTVLYEAGLITKEQLDSFEENGGLFPGQPSRNADNKIIYSSGSLGMGLSYAAGLAWNGKRKNKNHEIFVLVGDGELNEGSNWETVMFAAQQKLANLTVIVDWNGMQSDGFARNIMSLDMENVWKAFGWQVVTCDGHDEAQLFAAFSKEHQDKPKVILAQTIKGKGVSFMENNREWHHHYLSDKQYQEAVLEVNGS